jgi:hypothetical protein
VSFFLEKFKVLNGFVLFLLSLELIFVETLGVLLFFLDNIGVVLAQFFGSMV